MRLIDADCLRDYMWHACGETDEEIDNGRAKWESGLWIRYKVFEEALDKQITVEAEPVRHGRWQASIDGTDYRVCSICGYTRHAGTKYNYCPHCGADMRDEEQCR